MPDEFRLTRLINQQTDPDASKRLLRALAIDDWISPVVDRMHGSKEPERWVNPHIAIHPSSAGAVCPRAVELSMLGHRTAVKALNRRRMDNGTATHSRWNDYFQEAGLLYLANVREIMEEPFPWSGECDVIVKRPEYNTLHVGELKTKNERLFRRVPPQNPDKRAMAHELLDAEADFFGKGYVFQVTQYVVKLESLYGVSRECFFLFENTNSQEFLVRFFEPDDEIRAKAFDVQLTAQRATLEGKLLPIPRAFLDQKGKGPTCKKCYRRDVCWALENGDTELWQTIQKALAQTAGASGEQLRRLTHGFEDLEHQDSDDPTE